MVGWAILVYLLQLLDIVTTLLAGGLEVEINPFAVFMWSRWGFWFVVLTKLIPGPLMLGSWWVYQSIFRGPEYLEFKKVFRILLIVITVGGSAVPGVVNLYTLGVL